MKNSKRIARIEVCCVNLIDQVRDIQERIKCADEQPAPSVTNVTNVTNPANVALDVTIDADGVATHHCAAMPEKTTLLYSEMHNAWYVYGMPNLRVNFCPYCGADFRT